MYGVQPASPWQTPVNRWAAAFQRHDCFDTIHKLQRGALQHLNNVKLIAGRAQSEHFILTDAPACCRHSLPPLVAPQPARCGPSPTLLVCKRPPEVPDQRKIMMFMLDVLSMAVGRA